MFLKLEGIKGLGLGLVFKRIDPHLHYCSRSNRRPNFINCTSRFNFEFSRSLTCSSNLLNSSKDREYLHVSKIPTYHFQKSLPKLPIPELEKSCQRYFNAQLPLLSETEHKEVQRIVKDFQNGEGRELQKELVESDRKNKDSNYVSDVWFDMYLKDRRSVVLTHSPFLTFSDDPRPEYNTQLIKATNMLISSVRMMKTIRDEKLEPEVFHLNAAKSNTETFRTVCRLIPRSFSCYGAYLFKAFPLDMSQYKNLFNSCRIPRSEKDELFTDTNAKHILVMRNGHFYVFDMLDKEGNIIPENEVLSHLKFILENQISPPEFPVSALTTENRDIWTRARIQLINADPRNENKLRIIESAIFVLCLDDDQPKDPNDLSRKFLYGDGINRWFDKSFQLILTKEGTAGVNLEHSWGDGVALLRYIKEVFKDSIHNSLVNPNTTASSTANSDQKVQRLELRLDPYIKETITKAMQRFKEVTSTLDVQHLQYQKLNKKDIKNAKLSPDSVMQLVIQVLVF
uniref:Choline/carnitine acyltransferase domain-containing protein n=1 Tax=Biomphalaria glabrata TaxID=6526 RepID=A0A2C9JQV6_BIOGL